MWKKVRDRRSFREWLVAYNQQLKSTITWLEPMQCTCTSFWSALLATNQHSLNPSIWDSVGGSHSDLDPTALLWETDLQDKRTRATPTLGHSNWKTHTHTHTCRCVSRQTYPGALGWPCMQGPQLRLLWQLKPPGCSRQIWRINLVCLELFLASQRSLILVEYLTSLCSKHKILCAESIGFHPGSAFDQHTPTSTSIARKSGSRG